MLGMMNGDKKNSVSAIMGHGESSESGDYKEKYDDRKPKNNMEEEMYSSLMDAFHSKDVSKLKKSFEQAHEYNYMKNKK